MFCCWLVKFPSSKKKVYNQEQESNIQINGFQHGEKNNHPMFISLKILPCC